MSGPPPPNLDPQAQSQGGWRDIESAPKDGSPVLVASARPQSIRWAVWSGGFWRDGQVEAGGHICGVPTPSHWMPLPPPPATPTDAVGGGEEELTVSRTSPSSPSSGDPQAPLSDGWVMVPRDPGTCEGDDSAWLLAFLHGLHSHLPNDERPTSWMQFSDDQRERIKAAYRAMLAAAPSPPSESSDRGEQGCGPLSTPGNSGTPTSLSQDVERVIERLASASHVPLLQQAAALLRSQQAQIAEARRVLDRVDAAAQGGSDTITLLVELNAIGRAARAFLSAHKTEEPK